MGYYAPLVSILVAWVLTFLFANNKLGQLAQDIPNERSLHSKPVPRVGGVALILGTLTAWIGLAAPWWLVVPVLLLFALSLADDVYDLSPRSRLLGHFVAVLIALFGLGTPWLPVLLFFAVWMTNLYNFMDGSDGLAGGMAVFGFAAYAVVGWLAGDVNFALLNASLVAAACGFLCFNFHPAKIFMGDAGSIPLGFLAAILGVWGWQQDYCPWWLPLLVFSPFVVDASVTLWQRARRGEKLSQAHRTHYYQRLVQMGWGHKRTALCEYALMLACGASALWGMSQSFALQLLLLLLWCVIYSVLLCWIDRKWRKHADI